MAGEKVYMMVNGKLVEETCTENPLTCRRHGLYHSKRNQLRGVREEYVKKFFDTTKLPEREKQAKTEFQPPNHKRIGLRFGGEYDKHHEEEAVKLAEKLSYDEKESILYYTGAGYIDVLNHIYGRPRRIVENTKLADGTLRVKKIGDEYSDEEWSNIMQHHVDNMNKAIGLAGEQSEPEILYRVVQAHDEKGRFDRYANPAEDNSVEDFIDSNFKEGETFYRKTVTSTSADPAAVASFFVKPENRNSGNVVIIEYKSRRGARLSKNAGTSKMIHREYEVILPPYQKFKVSKVYKNVDYKVDARERIYDRGVRKDKFGNITMKNVTIVQVEEVD